MTRNEQGNGMDGDTHGDMHGDRTHGMHGGER